MGVKVYGIRNCDTVKKARAWLEANRVGYEFHDYKVAGVDPARLRSWTRSKGWERLLNRSGTTFRKLSDADKQGLDETRALALMEAHPSMIRRPVIEADGALLVGFDPNLYGRTLIRG